MRRGGVEVHTKTVLEKVTKDEATGKLTVHSKAGELHDGFDVVLMAIGESYWCSFFTSTSCR